MTQKNEARIVVGVMAKSRAQWVLFQSKFDEAVAVDRRMRAIVEWSNSKLHLLSFLR